MNWVSVEDRLPPTEEHILIFDNYGVGTAFFLPKDVNAIASGHPVWSQLSHWMPLPEPPESGND